MRIDDTRFSSSMKESSLQLDYLRTTARRLIAESESKDFVMEEIGSNEFYQREKALFDSRKLDHEIELTVMDDRIRQKRLELDELNSRLQKQQINESLRVQLVNSDHVAVEKLGDLRNVDGLVLVLQARQRLVDHQLVEDVDQVHLGCASIGALERVLFEDSCV